MRARGAAGGAGGGGGHAPPPPTPPGPGARRIGRGGGALQGRGIDYKRRYSLSLSRDL